MKSTSQFPAWQPPQKSTTDGITHYVRMEIFDRWGYHIKFITGNYIIAPVKGKTLE